MAAAVAAAAASLHASLASVHEWRASFLSGPEAGPDAESRADAAAFLGCEATLRRYLVARNMDASAAMKQLSAVRAPRMPSR